MQRVGQIIREAYIEFGKELERNKPTEFRQYRKWVDQSDWGRPRTRELWDDQP